MRKILLILGLMSLSLAACAGTSTETDEESLVSSAYTKAEEYGLEEIPVVTYENEDDWFVPTPPEEITLASGQVQVFEFSAKWCTFCRRMAPKVEALNELYGDEVNFVMLDMDLTGADEYGPFIDALNYNPAVRPGIYILDGNGEVVFRYLGEVDPVLIQVEIYEAMNGIEN